MEPLRELIARYAQDGRVAWIGIRPERRVAMGVREAIEIGPRGLVGDHGASDKRAVTLMQIEHLPVIGAMMGAGPVTPSDLRRNFGVSGVNLSALKGRQVLIGQAVLEITSICAPCSRMEETLGAGGYSAVRGHGGWCARVIEPGMVALGDRVRPL